MKILCFLLLISISVKAQEPGKIVLEKMENLSLFIPDLSFNLVNVDTVEGIEILYYYKRKDRCDRSLFFISDTVLNAEHKQLPLDVFLEKSGSNYHYMMYGNWTSHFGCEYNDVDTFKLCNSSLFHKQALNENFDSACFYKEDKGSYFAAARVKAVVYRFQSADLKYLPFFYHFADSNQQIRKLEKLIYKNVFERKYFCEPKLFKGVLTKDEISCMSTYR